MLSSFIAALNFIASILELELVARVFHALQEPVCIHSLMDASITIFDHEKPIFVLMEIHLATPHQYSSSHG